MQNHNERWCFSCWKTAGTHLFLIFIFGICNCQTIQRIKECGLTCSQEVQCKSKPATDILNLFCRDPPSSLPPAVLENMKISTVMKCKEVKQCSLYLNIKGTVNIDANIRGVEICSSTLSSSHNQCTSVRFSRHKIKRSGTQKVHFQYNCLEVGADQHLYVTMRTIPSYCNIELGKHYHVEDCQNKDIGKNIFSCLTGKLDYMVDEEKKTITVHASDILEEYNYHVRLCRKHFTCQDIGAYALIKKEDVTRSVTLPYSEIVPCLCIEGWSAFPDSRRIRLCPFKNETSTLWNNITYNHITQILAWKPSCPVQVNVSLCWTTETKDICVNLPNSLSTADNKVLYSKVDAHPKLCMKFTSHMTSWVRCPFAHGQFSGWDMKIAVTDELVKINIISQTKAKFSVIVCNRTQLTLCEPLQIFSTFSVEASDYVTLNLSSHICHPNICIQGWKSDVNYSFPMQICNIPCRPINTFYDENFLHIFTMATVLLILVTMIAFGGYIILTVHYHKQLNQQSALQAKMKHISSEIEGNKRLLQIPVPAGEESLQLPAPHQLHDKCCAGPLC